MKSESIVEITILLNDELEGDLLVRAGHSEGENFGLAALLDHDRISDVERVVVVKRVTPTIFIFQKKKKLRKRSA